LASKRRMNNKGNGETTFEGTRKTEKKNNAIGKPFTGGWSEGRNCDRISAKKKNGTTENEGRDPVSKKKISDSCAADDALQK